MKASPLSPDTPDAELVLRSQAGERTAFATLVTRHQAAACSVAYTVCGDFSASEDVAQEAFVAAWRQLPEIRETGRFRAWVCGIARNVAQSQVRRSGRRGDRVFDTKLPESIDEAATPLEQAIASEEATLLWQTLLQLPETYREPLVLFYQEQQSVAAVATALGLTQDTVKQRLSRGRALLRDEVAKRIETTLEQARPSAAFTQGVLNALPPLVVGLGASAAVGTAKAATVGASGSASSSAGATTGLAIGATVASGAVGLLGLYSLIRYIRSPNIPRAIRRATGQAALASATLSIGFAILIGWIANDHGATLETWGYAPVNVVAWAIALLALGITGFSIRASIALVRLPSGMIAPPRAGRRFASKMKFASLPLISVAYGPDAQRGERFGYACGWIAVGDIACGGIALGWIALGPVAIGGSCLGLLALGGVCIGYLVTGALTIGQYAVGGIALAWDTATGGVAVAHQLAIGTIALASETASGIVAIAPQVEAAAPWLQYLGWLSLLCVPALLLVLRQARGRTAKSSN